MLVLASGSPRRRELLSTIGLEFKILPVPIDERRLDGESPQEFASRLAKEKAFASLNEHRIPNSIYLAADTIVVLGNTVLGKPADSSDAMRMLGMLSGNTHTVITAVAIVGLDDENNQGRLLESFAVHTQVEFKKLSEAEMSWYVSTGEPHDKAGAYAAQGVGAMLIKSVSGSYTNVIGLPLAETVEALARCGAKLPFG